MTPIEFYAGRVVVDAFLFAGDNWPELAAWVGTASYVGEAAKPGDVVMRVAGGVRAVPREEFALTYWPRDRIPEAHRQSAS
jgi:hypothetical protein